MPPRRDRAARLRLATLSRADATLTRVRQWQLLWHVLRIWYEPMQRSRQALQRRLNILCYRLAMAVQTRRRLRVAFAAWALRPPPGPPPGLPPLVGERRYQ